MNGLLKFITCGSVDDGKSTLIGHMLYDAKILFADQEQALELDSKARSREDKLDYSLLLDGLMAEREQGITIDVAYRYFTTEKRSFIVADTPGHEEYTRNMAVGASFADLAVILIDATQGILIQTRRHARICVLMGIKHFVFAVNKMDLIHYDKAEFEKIEKDIQELAMDIQLDNVVVIPVSATEGDNVTFRSSNMPWYQRSPLLEYLENVNVQEELGETGVVMPVQRVCRPDYTFRGFQGRTQCGEINVGEEITVLPSGEKANVTRLLNGDKDVEHAGIDEPLTICLDREIDVSRGSVIVNGTKLMVSNMFTATILWMDDEKLIEGKNFLLKLGTKLVPATIMEIKYKVDVNSGKNLRANKVYKNEIVKCDIVMDSPIVYDKFDAHRGVGAFILINRISNMTSACGRVEHSLRRSENLRWQKLDVTREARSARMGQKPLTLWFTGLSGAGKSTLANEVEKVLAVKGNYTMLLDGDNVRMGLNRNLGFTEEDRIENIRRVAEVSKLMNDAGLIVLTAFISPYASDRQNARKIVGDSNFIEVYVSTPLETCENRDVKGFYSKARRGEIPNFTGVSAPYEKPQHPEITVDTSKISIEEATAYIIDELKKIINDNER